MHSSKRYLVVKNPGEELTQVVQPYLDTSIFDPDTQIRFAIRSDDKNYYVANIPRSVSLLKLFTDNYSCSVFDGNTEIAEGVSVIDVIKERMV